MSNIHNLNHVRIHYVDGTTYWIELLIGDKLIEVRKTVNYHDIGSIVSNWIHNGY